MARRGRRYKLLLETAPWWQIGGVVVGFFVLFSIAVIIGSLGPPVYNKRIESSLPTDSILKMKSPLKGSIGNMSPLNREFYFFAEFIKSRKASQHNFGFEMHDVQFSVDLVAQDSSGKKKTLAQDSTHTRSLICPYNQEICDPLVLFHQDHVAYSKYNMKVQFNDMELIRDDLLASSMKIGFVYLNAEMVRFEMIWRYTFVALSTVVLALFVLLVRRKQFWSSWHTEQKWTLVLLIFLIFCNDPLFFGGVHWIFPLLNVVFTTSFVSVLLLALLVFTHSILVPLPERTIIGFYFPKILLIGAFWIINITVFSWSSFHLRVDPAYDESEMPGYNILQVLSMALLMLYALTMLYYILQILGNLRKINIGYSARFKTLWGFTLVVVVGVLITFAISIFMGYAQNAGLFMSIIAIYNLYIFSLAFYFLPSKHLDIVSQEDLDDSALDGILSDDDNALMEENEQGFDL